MSERLTVAFIGNPNCGKTTLFNAFTGTNLKVANWPGVTVEKVEGAMKYHDMDIKLIDIRWKNRYPVSIFLVMKLMS